VERSSGAAPPRPSGPGNPAKQPERDLLTIEVERPGNGLVIIALTGELDMGTIPRLEVELLQELEANEGVIVDLRRLAFIDSSGIALLIKAHRATTESGSALHTVVIDGSQVERVFTVAGIARALPVLDRNQAVAALNGGLGEDGRAG
jgi:anti-sigma B factor antagonist